MKNLKYFPFERNKYFYGKLLSVEDFEVEQRYMNDKRRVLNRFLYGTGIVCGMNVLVVDDTTISVEPGLALDFSGREIAIDTPVTRRLSVIEGFENFRKAEDVKGYLYLCLDYDEKEKEEVHNVTGVVHTEYNRYQEGFRLYVTGREPSAENLSSSASYEKTRVLYSGNGIQIKQTVPRFVGVGGEAELKVTVENMGQILPIHFSYELELTGMEWEGKRFVKVEFQEGDHEKSHSYDICYRLKAITSREAVASLETVPGSFELSFGDQAEEAKVSQKLTLQVISGDVKERLIQNYYESAMDEIVRNNYQQSIYLAKLFVIRAGESYIIDSVEPVPFGQYVYNNMLSDMMNRLYLKEERERARNTLGNFSKNLPDSEKSRTLLAGGNVTTGTVTLDLGMGGSMGQRFFSEELNHNLGLGKVRIFLGDCMDMNEDGQVIYGSPEVFEEMSFRAETAARVNCEKGTFQIGIRLIEPTMTRFVRIDWMAVRDPAGPLHDMEEMELFIKPGILHIKTRESFFLKTEFHGTEPTEVVWSVKEEAGGSIEQNGKYTAPNLSGIYEVKAQSTVYEGLHASIFIVVRNED